MKRKEGSKTSSFDRPTGRYAGGAKKKGTERIMVGILEENNKGLLSKES